jgi:hypothetical protein
MQDSIDHRNRGGFVWQETAPLVEGPVAGDAEAAAFVGGGDEPPTCRCGSLSREPNMNAGLILPRGRSSATLIFLPEEAGSTCTARLGTGTSHYAVRLSEPVPGTARWISPANGRELEWDEIVTS